MPSTSGNNTEPEDNRSNNSLSDCKKSSNESKDPGTSPSQKDKQAIAFCKGHPKQRVQFFCVELETNICNLCVPSHSKHELKLLKECLAGYSKQWKNLLNQLT